VLGRAGTCHVNGILGLLCKTHFPGLVRYAAKLEPAFTFAHYEAAPNVEAGNKALLIIREFWVVYLALHGSIQRIDLTYFEITNRYNVCRSTTNLRRDFRARRTWWLPELAENEWWTSITRRVSRPS